MKRSLYGNNKDLIFGGILSFARQKYSRNLKGVDVAVVGIPFDLATSYRSGARFGPESIRKASAQLSWGPLWPWGFMPTNRLKIIDYGDLDFDYANPTLIAHVIETQMAYLLAHDLSTLSLGGDHFITLPILRAYSKIFGKISIIQFDAHTDTWKTSTNSSDHGTFMFHAQKEKIIDPKTSVQVGIRTDIPKDYGFTILDVEWICRHGTTVTVNKIQDVVKSNPVYLTFDIDCLDPSYAPGTGTPVVGGLSTIQVLDILRKLKGINFIGMDIVEVCPPYDTSEITALTAATIALEYLALYAVNKGVTQRSTQ